MSLVLSALSLRAKTVLFDFVPRKMISFGLKKKLQLSKRENCKIIYFVLTDYTRWLKLSHAPPSFIDAKISTNFIQNVYNEYVNEHLQAYTCLRRINFHLTFISLSRLDSVIPLYSFYIQKISLIKLDVYKIFCFELYSFYKRFTSKLKFIVIIVYYIQL